MRVTSTAYSSMRDLMTIVPGYSTMLEISVNAILSYAN
ncbi:unnamed protein product, partial [Brassica oleracea]